MIAALPPNEQQRLAVLHELELLDTEPEPALDALTRLAANLLDVPIAVVSLVDASRQWFKSKVGLEAGETTREVAFCAHAILETKPFVIEDARHDRRFVDNPLVTGAPHIRAYAGVPLTSLDGLALGTLCAIDRKPRRFTEREIQTLRDLAMIANREIESRERTVRARSIAADTLKAIEDSEKLYRATVDHAGIGIAVVALDGSWLRINPRMCRILDRGEAELRSLTFQAITHPEDLNEDLSLVRDLLDGNADSYQLEKRYLRPDGSTVWGNLTVTVVRRQDGTPSHFVSLVDDITQRKETEDALHKLTQHLEQRVVERTQDLARLNREQSLMLDNELIGIVKLKHRTAIWANRAFERLFGYEPGEAIGKPSRLLYADDATYEKTGREMYAALKEHGRYRVQLELQRKDGSRVWVDVSGAPVSRDADESLWMMQDISAMKSHQRIVEEMAFKDGLTGLPNRQVLMERMEHALSGIQRSSRSFAVVFVDLDGFKAVNDTHGHDAGDELLKIAARRLQDCVRPYDTVARLGGDEFVLLLAELGRADEADVVVERAATAVRRPIRLMRGTEIAVGASFGVAIACEGETAAEWLARADAAMYTRKRSDRHQGPAGYR